MEALKLKTLDDLLRCPDERCELIGGEIVRRPMARSEHGRAQFRASAELGLFDRMTGPGGWWIMTEVGVAYEVHQCPVHDLAGWRKERVPSLPTGIIETTPDWVCEIVSPGHERKDTLDIFLLLQRHRVPHYWIIWPEDQILIAHQLDGVGYRVIATLSGEAKARVPPFEAIEIDLAYILGE